VYLITDDDAGCGVVRELGIVGVAESFEERKGTREVGDGKVDEDFGVHGAIYFPVLFLFFQSLTIFPSFRNRMMRLP